MAQIAKKNNELAKKYAKTRTLMFVGYGVCLTCFALFALNMITFNFIILIPLMFGFLGGGIFGGVMMQKASSLCSGICGENATAEIIASLPENYCGFQNLKVTFDNKTSELDMVVVGPTGVFIIETKNMNGTIIGNCDSPQWVQHKIGQQGTPYSSNFYNPVKQVATHTYRLANFLRSNGINVYVNSMVYFSNPETCLQISGQSNTPVYSAFTNGAREMLTNITDRGAVVSNENILKIATLLNKL